MSDLNDLNLLISPLRLHRQGQPALDPDKDLLQALFGSLQLSPLLTKENARDGVEALAELLGRVAEQNEGDTSDDEQPGSDGVESVNTVLEDTLLRSGTESDSGGFEGTVERIRQQLVEQEKSLQGEHTQLDQAIDSLSSNSAAHSEATILCESGGRSAGRMLLHNPSDERVDVSFTYSFQADQHHSVDPGKLLDIVPQGLTLDADQSAAVSVCVDLTDVELGKTQELKLRIEAESGGRCLSICWLTIKIVDVS